MVSSSQIGTIIEAVNQLMELLTEKKNREERDKKFREIHASTLKLVGDLLEMNIWNASLPPDPEEKKQLETAKKKWAEVTGHLSKAEDFDAAGDDGKARDELAAAKDDLEELLEILEEIAEQKHNKYIIQEARKKEKENK